MQSCASAAKLRGGGPILNRGSKAMFRVGSPPPRIVICGSSPKAGRLAETSYSVPCRERAYVAGRRTMPSEASPVVTRCQSAMSSFLASATIMVLRVLPRASVVRARYHCDKPLVSWNLRKRHANCNIPRRTRALPALANPLSRRLLPALGRRTCQSGIARHRLAVPQLTQEDFVYQHVRCLYTDADDLCQKPDHRGGPVSGCLFHPLRAGRFDLLDLLPHKAQARQVALQLGQRVRRQRRLPACAASLHAAPERCAGWV